MKDDEYIKIPRRFFSDRFWKAIRTFSECEAWIDLIQSAGAGATDTVGTIDTIGAIGRIVAVREIEYGRGEYPVAIRHLAGKWGWTKRKVEGFLELLKRIGAISVDSSRGINVIRINHFDDFCPPPTKEAGGYFEYGKTAKKDASGTREGTPKGTPKPHKNSEKQTSAGHAAGHPRGHKRDTGGTNRGIKNNNILYTPREDYIPKDSSINNFGKAKAFLPRGKGELSPAPSAPDYSELVEFFNSATSGSFGTVRLPLSAARRGMIAARIRERGEDTFREAIQKAAASDFLRGQNRSGWRATFDWIIRPTNFEKIITGNYDNKRPDNAATHGAAGSTGGSAINEDFLRGVAAGIARGSCQKGGGRDGER